MRVIVCLIAAAFVAACAPLDAPIPQVPTQEPAITEAPVTEAPIANEPAGKSESVADPQLLTVKPPAKRPARKRAPIAKRLLPKAAPLKHVRRVMKPKPAAPECYYIFDPCPGS